MTEPTHGAVLPDDVVAALIADPRIQRVELAGSRARGTPTSLSDWDFSVTTGDFDAVRDELPRLVSPLQPVVALWDPLSPQWCYMFILTGPAKVDLLFGLPHPIHAPWQVTAESLPRIDDHFWDWALWLASKQLAGRRELVAAELGKMHGHLLEPLGVTAVPASIGAAVADYRAARASWEARLQYQVPRAAEMTVMPSLPNQACP